MVEGEPRVREDSGERQKQLQRGDKGGGKKREGGGRRERGEAKEHIVSNVRSQLVG